MPMIKLKSSDEKIFEVDLEVVRMSVALCTMLDNLGIEEDDGEPIPVPNVNSSILQKVIEWAIYHKNDPHTPENDDNREMRTDDISSWDAKFFEESINQGTLSEIILAANYLDIKGLLDVTCKVVANMIRGKTREEICKNFNFSDSTPQEEAKIRRDNHWCEKK